jgi:starch synthase (maltosyl-transferring)
MAHTSTQTPIIYNLFPLLAGGFDRWPPHLQRARAMGFDWLYFNPVSYPGFSGSMYAVKEHRGFHPVLWGDDWQAGAAAFADTLATMTDLGLKPMMDLVINHTAIDCPLIKTQPNWFQHGPDGKIVHPGAKDGNKMIYWGDLAAVDNAHSPDRDALWAFWDNLIAHHQSLGVKGFRCDAAYHVPADLWRHLIGRAKDRDPQARFFAETLGCEIEDVIALAEAGFDYTFNSSKWWDFKAPWLLDQYAKSREIAPSISFAESHDSERLADECHGDVGQILARYAFACLFSTGVMMPMGFEFGAARKLNVVRTRPDHLDMPPDAAMDLSLPIGQLNQFKRDHPVFHSEGPWRALENTPPGSTMLVKRDERGLETGLITLTRKLNKTAPEPPEQYIGWREVTPSPLLDHGSPLRVFVSY